MIAIAYWNIRKGKGTGIAKAIADLAEALRIEQSYSGLQHEVLLCLAEPGKVDFHSILADLNSRSAPKTWWLISVQKRFVFLGTLAANVWQPAQGLAGGSLASSLVRSPQDVFEIWFVHGPAPIHVWNPTAILDDTARDLRESIEKREDVVKHAKTVAIGDFNMEPFNVAMVKPKGLNATPCKTIAATSYKQIRKGEKIQYFFNPMWEHLGSWQADRQPGSFYAKNDRTSSFAWHLIDQVLVRPALITAVRSGTPTILTRAGGTPLTTASGEIAAVSDHLPVLVSLDI